MLVLLLLLTASTQAFADVVVYGTGWSSKGTSSPGQAWFWIGKGHQGGDYVVEFDSVQTRTTTTKSGSDSSVDSDRLLAWAFQQINSLADGYSGKPVYLDVSVVERKTTTGPTFKHSSKEVLVANGSSKETRRTDVRHAVLLILLFVSCMASWVLFFVQAHRLAKRFRKRREKKLKKTTKKNELKLPLLEHESAMK